MWQTQRRKMLAQIESQQSYMHAVVQWHCPRAVPLSYSQMFGQ